MAHSPNARAGCMRPRRGCSAVLCMAGLCPYTLASKYVALGLAVPLPAHEHHAIPSAFVPAHTGTLEGAGTRQVQTAASAAHRLPCHKQLCIQLGQRSVQLTPVSRSCQVDTCACAACDFLISLSVVSSSWR